MTLDEHFALILEERCQSLLAPLSARRAMLVAVLLDHFADRIFAQFRTGMPDFLYDADDLPAYRASLAAASPALATIFALASGRGETLLRLDAVEVPIEDYPTLSVPDFMVSLYNGNTVQRVVIVSPDGATALAHDTIGAALAYWEAIGWR